MVALAHMAKATAKLSNWGGYLPLALGEPVGEQTFSSIANGDLAAPSRLVGLSPIGWVMLIVMVVIAAKSVRWMRASSPRELPAAVAGLVVTAVLFGSVLAVWTFV